MRKLLSLLIIIVGTFHISCSEKTLEETNFGKVSHQLNVSTTNISLGAESDLSATLTIEAENTSWEILDIPSWLNVSPSSGSGTKDVTITAQKTNSVDETRMAILRVHSVESGFNLTKEITVSQNSEGGFVTPSMTQLSFEAGQESKTINIDSNVAWKAECQDSWVMFTYSSDTELIISVQDNIDLSTARNTKVFLKRQGMTEVLSVIEINQSAARLDLSESSMSFIGEGETKSMTIDSNFKWEIISCPDWIRVSQKNDENGTYQVSITAACKPSFDIRKGKIDLGHSGKILKSIAVDQEASTGQDREFTITGNGKSVTFKMKWVHNGSFKLAFEDTEVILTNNFFIGETEVTLGLWLAVMGEPQNDYSWLDSMRSSLGENYPAPFTFVDCQKFINRLNEITGERFRMLTEAEWEYAARGGEKSRGYQFAGSDNADEVAWYELNSNDESHPVSTKKPNELGLYDMSGNYAEWCSDWWGTFEATYYVYHEKLIDPTGLESPHSFVYHNSLTNESSIEYWGHVIKGGCYSSSGEFIRPSYSVHGFGYEPDHPEYEEQSGASGIGLRIAI